MLVPLWASEFWAWLRNWWRRRYWQDIPLTDLAPEQQKAVVEYRRALNVAAPPWAYVPYNARDTADRIERAGSVVVPDQASKNQEKVNNVLLKDSVLTVAQESERQLQTKQEQTPQALESKVSSLEGVDLGVGALDFAQSTLINPVNSQPLGFTQTAQQREELDLMLPQSSEEVLSVQTRSGDHAENAGGSATVASVSSLAQAEGSSHPVLTGGPLGDYQPSQDALRGREQTEKENWVSFSKHTNTRDMIQHTLEPTSRSLQSEAATSTPLQPAVRPESIIDNVESIVEPADVISVTQVDVVWSAQAQRNPQAKCSMRNKLTARCSVRSMRSIQSTAALESAMNDSGLVQGTELSSSQHVVEVALGDNLEAHVDSHSAAAKTIRSKKPVPVASPPRWMVQAAHYGTISS